MKRLAALVVSLSMLWGGLDAAAAAEMAQPEQSAVAPAAPASLAVSAGGGDAASEVAPQKTGKVKKSATSEKASRAKKAAAKKAEQKKAGQRKTGQKKPKKAAQEKPSAQSPEASPSANPEGVKASAAPEKSRVSKKSGKPPRAAQPDPAQRDAQDAAGAQGASSAQQVQGAQRAGRARGAEGGNTGGAMPVKGLSPRATYDQCLEAAAGQPGAARQDAEKQCRRAYAATRTLTPKALWDAFREDRQDAEERYQNKLVGLRGTVTQAGMSKLGFLEVVFHMDAYGRNSVRCRFPAGARDALARLRPGDTVSLGGICTGLSSDGHVRLDHCEMYE